MPRCRQSPPASAAGAAVIRAADEKDIAHYWEVHSEYNCRPRRHRGGQNIIMPEKTLEREDLEQYLDGGFNEKAVIRPNGKNAMSAFGGRAVPDDDIAQRRRLCHLDLEGRLELAVRRATCRIFVVLGNPR